MCNVAWMATVGTDRRAVVAVTADHGQTWSAQAVPVGPGGAWLQAISLAANDNGVCVRGRQRRRIIPDLPLCQLLDGLRPDLCRDQQSDQCQYPQLQPGPTQRPFVYGGHRSRVCRVDRRPGRVFRRVAPRVREHIHRQRGDVGKRHTVTAGQFCQARGQPGDHL